MNDPPADLGLEYDVLIVSAVGVSDAATLVERLSH